MPMRFIRLKRVSALGHAALYLMKADLAQGVDQLQSSTNLLASAQSPLARKMLYFSLKLNTHYLDSILDA